MLIFGASEGIPSQYEKVDEENEVYRDKLNNKLEIILLVPDKQVRYFAKLLNKVLSKKLN